MARRVPWRRTCPDVVVNRIEDASQARIYLLRETGPTGFLLKEDGVDRKFKVFLGDQHSCTCQTFMREKELCVHILWILLKKFRIPKENQIIFQLSLVEREINEVMRGCHARSNRAQANDSSKNHREPNNREKLKQKDIETEDVCPICQDEFLKQPEPLTYCKYGCGNSVHMKCMKVWAEHQRSTGENIIKCPLCRVDFGSFQELMDEYNKSSRLKTRADRQDLHLGAACKKCRVCPIAGKCYRCVVCADYHLCHTCFATDIHMQHSFQFRQKPSQRWRAASRITPSPNAVINDLQSRDISDGDYELLLQLDKEVTDREGLPPNIIYNLPTQMLQDGHRLLCDGSTCGVCLQGFQQRQCVRTLPCQHAFHISCVDNWLTNHSQCPVDGSYARSVAIARSVTHKQPNGPSGVSPGMGRHNVGSFGSHSLGGATSKRPGQKLKTQREPNDTTEALPSSFTLSGSALLAQNHNKARSTETGVRSPVHTHPSSPTESLLLRQPSFSSHDSSATQLIRLSSAVRDGTRQSPQPSPGAKVFTRHNISVGPLDAKPPMPPRNLTRFNKGSSSSETKLPKPRLDRSRRSSSLGELSFLASGTAVQMGSQTPPLTTNDRHKPGQLIKGKLAAKSSRQSLSDPGLAFALEPLIASGISVYLPPVDVD